MIVNGDSLRPEPLTYAAANGSTHEIRFASPSPKLLAMRIKRGTYLFEDGELLKRCSRCREHWPADTEFFYAAKGDDGLNAWCKACYQEWRYPAGRSS